MLQLKVNKFFSLKLEGKATARAIRLAAFVNAPLYVVHVMSSDAMEEIATAQKSGQNVIREPVVSGLVLDDSVLWNPDFITATKQVTQHKQSNKQEKTRRTKLPKPTKNPAGANQNPPKKTKKPLNSQNRSNSSKQQPQSRNNTAAHPQTGDTGTKTQQHNNSLSRTKEGPKYPSYHKAPKGHQTH
ncbi:hypothetical protein LXL04_028707 [Taraxacum kok-saghyz]